MKKLFSFCTLLLWLCTASSCEIVAPIPALYGKWWILVSVVESGPWPEQAKTYNYGCLKDRVWVSLRGDGGMQIENECSTWQQISHATAYENHNTVLNVVIPQRAEERPIQATVDQTGALLTISRALLNGSSQYAHVYDVRYNTPSSPSVMVWKRSTGEGRTQELNFILDTTRGVY